MPKHTPKEKAKNKAFKSKVAKRKTSSAVKTKRGRRR